jgi:hypothetical protein
VALVGISIDASFLHGKVAALAGEHLGRSVSIGGPSRLTISLTPGIILRDIEADGRYPAGSDTIRIAEFSPLSGTPSSILCHRNERGPCRKRRGTAPP